MSYKTITHVEREDAYVAGREAFGEHKGRGYNPHAASNLILAVLWWHGWDTAEEENNGETGTLYSTRSALMLESGKSPKLK